MIIELIVGQLFLIIFNVANAYIDAYRILKNKTIAHAINFGAYLIFTGLISFLLGLYRLPGLEILFFLSAFFNRQLSFDIPLNLRRGLPWDYQSTANPPKPLMDRIERFMFGSGDVGKSVATFYGICYFAIINIWVWII